MAGSVPPVRDEREGLLAYLAQQRYTMKLTAHGLTDEQARLVPSASELSVGGLIKHVADMERGWMDTVLGVTAPGNDGDTDHYADNFRLGPDETLAEVLDAYDAAAARTDRIIAGIEDLGRAVPVPQGVPWFPQDVEAWSVRWVLLHLIEETARHNGHADIVREHVDGATAFPLMAAAEGWPATPWMQPWSATPVGV
jgi:uncharacterized damage-inducible protein DinB